MAKAAKAIPEGYHSVTPYLVVGDAAKALDFYKKALGATVTVRMDGPNGKITHAEFRIGDSTIMLSDEMPQGACKAPQTLGGATSSVFLYIEDVDKIFNQAVAAGSKSVMPPTDQFWGDRFGTLIDPFGQVWSIATHIEDVAPEEMKRRSDEFMAKMAQQQKAQAAR
jgi:PhnB protein